MFWLEDGLPSSLVPGRRPRTTLSPSLGLRDGEPRLAFGTPGGDQQDQWQLCFWLAHTAGGLDLQAAIDAPAWHSTAFPSSFAPRGWEPGGLVVESRLGAGTLDDLRRRGHAVVDAGEWALGRMCAVGRGDGRCCGRPPTPAAGSAPPPRSEPGLAPRHYLSSTNSECDSVVPMFSPTCDCAGTQPGTCAVFSTSTLRPSMVRRRRNVAQRDDHHVGVLVLGGLVTGPVPVLQDADALVLEHHGVELRIGRDRVEAHGRAPSWD